MKNESKIRQIRKTQNEIYATIRKKTRAQFFKIFVSLWFNFSKSNNEKSYTQRKYSIINSPEGDNGKKRKRGNFSK